MDRSRVRVRAHLVQQGVPRALLLHTQVTHPAQQLVGVEEEAGAEQEGEDVGPLEEQEGAGG